MKYRILITWQEDSIPKSELVEINAKNFQKALAIAKGEFKNEFANDVKFQKAKIKEVLSKREENVKYLKNQYSIKSDNELAKKLGHADRRSIERYKNYENDSMCLLFDLAIENIQLKERINELEN